MTRQQQYEKLLAAVEAANGTDDTPEARERFRKAEHAFDRYVWMNRRRITVRSGTDG